VDFLHDVTRHRDGKQKFDTSGKSPATASSKQVSAWAHAKAKYFRAQDGTTQISLNGPAKSDFSRTRFRRLKGRRNCEQCAAF
jgi:hypothetical protein